MVTARCFDATLNLLRSAPRCGAVVSNTSTEPWTRQELVARAHDADALVCFMTDTVDAELLDACPKLSLVACALKGFDNFDVAECGRRGVAEVRGAVQRRVGVVRGPVGVHAAPQQRVEGFGVALLHGHLRVVLRVVSSVVRGSKWTPAPRVQRRPAVLRVRGVQVDAPPGERVQHLPVVAQRGEPGGRAEAAGRHGAPLQVRAGRA